MSATDDSQTPNRTKDSANAIPQSHVSIPTELYCILLKSALSDVNFGHFSPGQVPPINSAATNTVMTFLNKQPSQLEESSNKLNLLVNKYLSEQSANAEKNTLNGSLKDSVDSVRSRLNQHFNILNSISSNHTPSPTAPVPSDNTFNDNILKPTENDTATLIPNLEQLNLNDNSASPSRWLISPKRIFGSNNVNTPLSENNCSGGQHNTPIDYNITGILDEIKNKFEQADNTIANIEAQIENDLCDPNKREWEFSSFMGPSNSDQSVIFEHARALYTNLYNHAKTNKLKISALRDKLATLKAHIKPVPSDYRNSL